MSILLSQLIRAPGQAVKDGGDQLAAAQGRGGKAVHIRGDAAGGIQILDGAAILILDTLRSVNINISYVNFSPENFSEKYLQSCQDFV